MQRNRKKRNRKKWDEPGPPIQQIGPRLYITFDSYIFDIDKYIIKVKKGFTYDGASIPRLFWTLIGSPFTGGYAIPALCHDALYKSKLLDKKTADLIFKELMIDKQVSKIKTEIIYNIVRFFGHHAYNKEPEQTNLVTIQKKKLEEIAFKTFRRLEDVRRKDPKKEKMIEREQRSIISALSGDEKHKQVAEIMEGNDDKINSKNNLNNT